VKTVTCEVLQKVNKQAKTEKDDDKGGAGATGGAQGRKKKK
jgi:hypothetical protein